MYNKNVYCKIIKYLSNINIVDFKNNTKNIEILKVNTTTIIIAHVRAREKYYKW